MEEFKKPLNETQLARHNSTISDKVKINTNLVTSGKVWFDESGVMHIKGTVYDNGTGQGSKFVNVLNKGMTGVWRENKETFKISTEFELTDDRRSDFTVRLVKSENPTPDYKGLFLGGALIEVNQMSDNRTYIHEFGHLLGLQHRPMGEKSLMGFWYPPKGEITKLQVNDAKRLYEAYKPVYERFVIFSKK